MNRSVLYIQGPGNSEAAAAVARSVSVITHNKKRLNGAEARGIQIQHALTTESLLFSDKTKSFYAFSYRVKPNPAEGKGELQVLRHCVQQQA